MLDYEHYLGWDFAFLEVCEALLFLGSSPGADRERAHAEALGIPIFESVEGIDQ